MQKVIQHQKGRETVLGKSWKVDCAFLKTIQGEKNISDFAKLAQLFILPALNATVLRKLLLKPQSQFFQMCPEAKSEQVALIIRECTTLA